MQADPLDARSRADALPTPARPSRKRGRILVVEDDHAVRDAITTMLHDYEVETVSSGEDALRLLRAGAPFDLLIASIDLWGRYDGFALARQARALRRGMPVIYMTAYDDDLREDDFCDRDGELVRMPSAPQDIRRAVARAISVAV
jgi:CheY-like chemotaxis protein